MGIYRGQTQFTFTAYAVSRVRHEFNEAGELVMVRRPGALQFTRDSELELAVSIERATAIGWRFSRRVKVGSRRVAPPSRLDDERTEVNAMLYIHPIVQVAS